MAWTDSPWLKNKIYEKLEEILSKLQNKLSTIESNIKTSITSNESNIKTAISNSESNIKNNDNSNRDNIKTSISNSQTAIINNDNTNRDNIKTSISNSQTAITTKVDNVKSVLDTTKTNVDTIKSDVSTSKTNLTSLTDKVTTLTNTVNTINTSVNTVKTEVTEVKQSVGNIVFDTSNIYGNEGGINIRDFSYGYTYYGTTKTDFYFRCNVDFPCFFTKFVNGEFVSLRKVSIAILYITKNSEVINTLFMHYISHAIGAPYGYFFDASGNSDRDTMTNYEGSLAKRASLNYSKINSSQEITPGDGTVYKMNIVLLDDNCNIISKASSDHLTNEVI